MPSLRATACGGGAAVAGQHDDAEAVRAQRRDAPRGVVALIGSATAIEPGRPAVDGDEHHGLRRRAAARRPRLERSRASTPSAASSAALPTRDRAAVDRAGDALAGDATAKSAAAVERSAALLGRG